MKRMEILTTNRTNGTNRYVGCIPATGWGGIGLMDVILIFLMRAIVYLLIFVILLLKS